MSNSIHCFRQCDLRAQIEKLSQQLLAGPGQFLLNFTGGSTFEEVTVEKFRARRDVCEILETELNELLRAAERQIPFGQLVLGFEPGKWKQPLQLVLDLVTGERLRTQSLELAAAAD